MAEEERNPAKACRSIEDGVNEPVLIPYLSKRARISDSLAVNSCW